MKYRREHYLDAIDLIKAYQKQLKKEIEEIERFVSKTNDSELLGFNYLAGIALMDQPFPTKLKMAIDRYLEHYDYRMGLYERKSMKTINAIITRPLFLKVEANSYGMWAKYVVYIRKIGLKPNYKNPK